MRAHARISVPAESCQLSGRDPAGRLICMDFPRLRLTLEPTLPSRTPTSGSAECGHGFLLRLVDGPAVEHDDPLLRAFAAEVVQLYVGADEEALQHECFDPGRLVRLEPEPYKPHDPDAVGVWDPEGLRKGGELPGNTDAAVTAALEQGLPMEAVVLWEERERLDRRRTGLTLLVHSPALVAVEGLDDLAYSPPPVTGRPRLVLFADGSGDVRWWDPSGGGGPVDVDAVPVSGELREALERLRDDAAELHARAAVGADDDFDRLDERVERHGLEEDARELWVRARRELARRFAVGFLGRGMTRPVWSPDELEADEDDDCEEPW